MNSSIGYGLVLSGLASAAFAAVVGLWSGLTRRESLLPWVRNAIYIFAASMLLSNLVMVESLLSHDFSVKYVAQVGSRETPTLFTIVSLWSALEGSILFWGAIMGAYLFAFAFTYRKEHGRYMQLSLGMMAVVAVFFAFLIAGPANPWTLLPNPPANGPGPNPLLQNHPLMIIHPPMLYLGYVGMTVPFGIATGALLRGELGDSWLVPMRKWSLIPWTFLSVGIILGSWWAYAVLGWGGYWAWDPVENASFHPWLTITAFIHSGMVLERKKMLKLWTLALALASFVLTVVGTFMTRSGVFNSVHSFTQSDIGPTFLVFIAVLIVFCVVLLSVRGGLLVAESNVGSLASREGSLLVNNVIFTALTFTVLLGTIYPLVNEGLFGRRISVGEPYFNVMAVPIGMLMLFLMGVGPMLPWGESKGEVVRKQIALPAALGGAVTLGFLLRSIIGYLNHPPAAVAGDLTGFARYWEGGGRGDVFAALTFGLAVWAATVNVRELLLPARQHKDLGFMSALMRSASQAPRRFGGYVVHLGIVAIFVAVAASSTMKEHNSGTVRVGEALPIGNYKIRFDGLEPGGDPAKKWQAANITVINADGSEIVKHGKAAPRFNYYPMSNDPVGSPMVEEGLLRDVYVSLLAVDPKAGTATFNTWVFPLVGWIWYAIPILVFGSLVALWPRRKVQTAVAPAAANEGAVQA